MTWGFYKKAELPHEYLYPTSSYSTYIVTNQVKDTKGKQGFQ